MERVNFTTRFGDRVSFDENGDALAIYDVMNWQKGPDGAIKLVTVGVFDESSPGGQMLRLDEDKIFWNFEMNTVSSPPRRRQLRSYLLTRIHSLCIISVPTRFVSAVYENEVLNLL